MNDKTKDQIERWMDTSPQWDRERIRIIETNMFKYEVYVDAKIRARFYTPRRALDYALWITQTEL